MKKIAPLLGLLGTLLSACSNSDTAAPDTAKLITKMDFESVEGWMPPTPSLTREQAHSGRFSVKVDGNNEFSMGYSNLLGRVAPSRLRKIKVQAWVYLASEKSQARLGVQITDPVSGKELFGDGIALGEQVKEYKKWKEVSKEISLPDNVTATQNLKVFLWRASASDAAYLDDVQLSIVE
ncbi:carbohydrate binding domain-containing protein [Hymenobacter sp. BT175]|uniref:carbohydrate binding domain-containing protein n=1 Tax=Hymenobacter translucens TaxID=2886507 RepID=UPI001D0EAF71|nr:carbohydrate binding domain-containing protein [Hymenobacter translucens]MCC2545883.1 carbohydrate binding domain-containing protein [Hymenobacter translucens]